MTSQDDGGPDASGPDVSGQEDDSPDASGRSAAKQARKAEREARRRAKDDAYEQRLARKKSKDVKFWHGRQVIDAEGLSEAFPEPETPEYAPSTVRRRIVHGVTLVVLLALVVTGVVLAGMIQRGELELKLGFQKPTPPAITCPSETLDYPANATVVVNVYNAGAREGMAGQVAEALKVRGYQVKLVANANTSYRAPVVVVSGPSGHAAAFNLQHNVADSEYVQDDRADASIDFILTGDYKGLVEAQKVDQTPGLLSCPRLSPSPKPSVAPSPSPAPDPGKIP